jgi:hypothetical protein
MKPLPSPTVLSAAALVLAAHSQEPQSRKELKRSDLTGQTRRSWSALSRFKALVLHIHLGEAFYVFDGATIELADGKQVHLQVWTARG